ncbi:MAG TPA: hypothetical protein VGG48_14575 [Rhizomicrobium sp.]|jgi:hypothetical protein
MKALWKATAAAMAMAGATLFGAGTAQAGIHLGVNINVPVAVPGGVAADYDSGGYCDSYGCPDGYWDYPVYYGPVYSNGAWFNGPVYYRDYGGERWFWVRGGWRRDEWRGPRPGWWRNDYRTGPALGYEFYLGHGFHHDRDHYWRGDDWRPGHDWDHSWYDHHHGDHGDHHDFDHHDHDHGGMGGGDHHDGHDDHHDHHDDHHDGDHHDDHHDGHGDHHDGDHHDHDHDHDHH